MLHTKSEVKEDLNVQNFIRHDNKAIHHKYCQYKQKRYYETKSHSTIFNIYHIDSHFHKNRPYYEVDHNKTKWMVLFLVR